MRYFLVLDSWAGRRFYEVDIIGETPKKFRVKVLNSTGVKLPSGRHVDFGEITLVPKHAVISKE